MTIEKLMSDLITTEQLKAATGASTIPALEKCLREQKIKFLYGRGGRIFTTLDAINAAMGLKSENQQHDDIEFL